ncbi:unnamed protein product, partial [Mesorhabditis belari]|uniref:AB hydrolase-1 domain-containing protein n=1 Tax=Mesorhabditis belari TaxID=2138241 RepID=A0AAF3E9Z8_9BILA
MVTINEEKSCFEKAKEAAPRILEMIVLYSFTAFYSVLVTLDLIYQRVFKGQQVCHKEIHQRPDVLENWEHHYVQLNDIRMHYVQSGSDDKPLMVLIHGFPEFWYSWRFQLKYFSSQYRVVAIDQRGYNESDRPSKVADYDVRLLAADIDQLIKKLGHKKAIVAGHDWGALVAWHVALTYPQSVERLVILNVPHPAVAKKNMRSNLKQFLASWYIFFFQAPILPEFVVSSNDYKMLDTMMRGRKGGIRLHRENFGEEEVECWKYVFSQQGAITGPINFYRAALRYPKEVTFNDFVKPPTLIVWGDADPFLIKEGAQQSVELCENGRVAYVEGASHWVQQDDPETVNRLIEQFLEERL